jgi:hypothetical protein
MNGYRYYVILHTISYENGDVTVDMINCDYNNWFNEIFMLFRDNTNLYLFISNMPYSFYNLYCEGKHSFNICEGISYSRVFVREIALSRDDTNRNEVTNRTTIHQPKKNVSRSSSSRFRQPSSRRPLLQ